MGEAGPIYHGANTQTCSIRLTNQPVMCVFGMWEEHYLKILMILC